MLLVGVEGRGSRGGGKGIGTVDKIRSCSVPSYEVGVRFRLVVVFL